MPENQFEEFYYLGKSKVTIGRFTYGQKNLKIHQWGEGANLTVGAFCSIAANVSIFLGGNHRLDWASTFPFGHAFENFFGEPVEGHPRTNGDIEVGSDVWIGTGACLMSGINVGHGAVIAASSHVVKDVPPYTIFGGNPAKLIRKRFEDEIIRLLLDLKWWELEVNQIKALIPILTSAPTPDVLKKVLALLGHQG